MILAEKTLARFADALPCVLEACEAVFVERHGASGAVERAKDAIVPCRQCEKCCDGQREQPDRGTRPEHEPEGQGERGNGGKAGVAEARVQAGEARMFRRARRPPFAIFTQD